MKTNFLITYDVRDNHEQIIADLLAKGWHSVVPARQVGTQKPVFCYLPETTWYKSFETANDAGNEFLAISGINNTLRYMVTSFINWEGSTVSPKQHQVEEAKNMRLLPALN